MRTKEEIWETARDLDISYTESAMIAMDEHSKEVAIALLKWVNRPEAMYAPMFDEETWAGNETDISTEELFNQFIKDK